MNPNSPISDVMRWINCFRWRLDLPPVFVWIHVAHTFGFMFMVLICLSSFCVANGASFSRLSLFDNPFGFLFLIAPSVFSNIDFPHVSKMSSHRYNRSNILNIENAIVLNSMHNIYNLRDTFALHNISPINEC